MDIAHTLKAASITALRLYNRLDISVAQPVPDTPVLFVANHGFGGIVDLNVFAFAAAYDRLGLDRALVTLTHQIAWTLHVEKLIEPFGARPADRRTALRAFREGNNVLVFPGGDLDALKSWRQRDDIVFSGRTGYARLAIEAGVPVVPVVTAGAGESLFVFGSGTRLARALGVDRLLRLKALPLSMSVPWGLNLGLVGLLPYFPLPTKLDTSVLAPMSPRPEESAESFAHRIHTAMQNELDSLTADRRPVIG
ncbi:1-acyl-sn-glycerol-3-phosphate acyltransferase [Rhodococcus sp. BP-349]|uniref:1-acyl-sn-glycerol-3-phosphate acyltransferase n=1 Tax=unclassified Rhodococcus (in: high G+C Gram-positive bacteria) TaxID=192944 RepID=UPI001C9A7D0B|nr:MULTISPECIES: 1-acyl-sn-glycerol-3-phosphate acyltransferase [unclassified Rhodococcus (in: high G+C Gram-positive bacteria)]MBY6537918.1 1-acyl-sn-glycerol-3-phosphate acyltransferase [Rhodococcus sp. BP-363]MBY6542255.1 1-acyl-sn-glycerol-3-phosphate acyltransferase [Rhodococcus sp. BP-369]MBY6561485.1 1-acyl-sn-glycerol-3-phosphate acyltransferase [Rhodococcus sp. BP-370]MBY6575777.1 1-acyl-sn-glycerol-3-phosphate acyltransferase [Rhodococcus sp. BP-364]MBY6585078.1 1-acyl-sn-glycerol-3-